MRLVDAWDLEAKLRDSAAELDTTIYTAPADQINGLYRIFLCLIRHSPIIDAEPVVRCKDCIHRDGTPGQPNILCYQMHEDDFCSYGERREDAVD